MFPSDLATGLCSLNPQVDRLVQSCLMEVDRRTGAVVRYEMHDGVIHSQARMTYTVSTRSSRIAIRRRSIGICHSCRCSSACSSSSRSCTAGGGARGSIDFDLKESKSSWTTRARSKPSSPRATSRTGSSRVHAPRERGRSPRISKRTTCRRSTACTNARSGEGRRLRGVHLDARLHDARSRRRSGAA